jgi:glycosyltransferase involved in cell wall biosynthesis
MKVLHVASWYPRDATDITGIFVQNHIRCLASHVEQIAVVPALDGPGTLDEEMGWFVARPRVPSSRGPWLVPYMASVLRQARQFGPDLIHGHVARPGGVAALWTARRMGRPMVLTEHANPFGALLATHALNRAAARWAVRGADACTAVSVAQAADIQAAVSGVDPIVVPNAVDMQRFQSRVPPTDGRVRLLFVGRLVATKRCDILLDALQDPRLAGFRWSLRVVGSGPEENALRARAAPLGAHVRFEGYQGPTVIPGLLSQADALVLPSQTESFGVVLIEALAAGVPVLATRCGGPEDIVTDEVGRLVMPDNVSALVEGLKWMFTRHRSFAPAKLRAYAESRFGFPAVARRLLDVYRRAMAEHAARL